MINTFANRTTFLRAGALLLLLCLLAACGARRIGERQDARALLKEGRYAEARAAAIAAGLSDQTNRAIVAISHIAENPTPAAAEKAVFVMTEEARNVRAAATAMEMLDLALEIPQPVRSDVSMRLAEAALGAVSYGPFAPTPTPTITVGAASRDLAAVVLARVADALQSESAVVEEERLLTIWNSCFSLDGGSFESDSDFHAWRLFKSLSSIALFVNGANPNSDLANVLLGASITVIEANPEISVAARCDLSSPFEKLKSTLAQKRDQMARLEKVVAGAMGCTLGTYAPTEP